MVPNILSIEVNQVDDDSNEQGFSMDQFIYKEVFFMVENVGGQMLKTLEYSQDENHCS